MGRIVIAVYRAKPGKIDELTALITTHVPRLREQSLVTERQPIIMQSGDDTFIEVFEWMSNEAIEQAHTNPAVLEMWQQFGEVAEYLPVGKLPEAANLFSEFSPVDLD